MHVSFGLTLFILLLFGVVAAIVSVSVPRRIEIPVEDSFVGVENEQWHLNLKIVAGLLLILYAIGGLSFVAFADATFRSALGPVVNELQSPLFLRGVHLGLNISGMLLPMPLFSLVGIPTSIYQLRVWRRNGGAAAGFTATWVCGTLAFVSIVAFVIFVIVAGSRPSGSRQNEVLTALAKIENGCFNRTTRQTFATASTNTIVEPLVDRCPLLTVSEPVSWLLLNPILFAIIIVPAVFNLAFLILGDRVILREISPPKKVVRVCTECSNRIQYVSKGSQKPTCVKCHKCGVIRTFED